MKRQTTIIIILTLVIGFLLIGNYISTLSPKEIIRYRKASQRTKENKLTIMVEVDKKRLLLIDRDRDEILKTYYIATGKKNTPTPLGTFKVVHKAHWGEGFGSRWIGLNVPWGNYGIHGTNNPSSVGYNASAGCIRMRNRDVEELYSLIEKNTIVLIMNGDFGHFGYGLKSLRPGARGAEVLEVQKRLEQKGYYLGNLDGIYGEEMKAALLKYLKDKKIPLTDEIDTEIYYELGIILMD